MYPDDNASEILQPRSFVDTNNVVVVAIFHKQGARGLQAGTVRFSISQHVYVSGSGQNSILLIWGSQKARPTRLASQIGTSDTLGATQLPNLCCAYACISSRNVLTSRDIFLGFTYKRKQLLVILCRVVLFTNNYTKHDPYISYYRRYRDTSESATPI